MNDIQIIDESKMLASKEIQSLSSVAKSIDEGFARRQRFRPKFLMETSVLNNMKFPTPDSKFWQCNVERDTHFRNLVMLSFDYREKLADIKILEEELIVCESVGLQMKKQVQLERENAALLYMRREAQERVREVMGWSEIMDELEPQLKYDPNDVEAHMPEAFAIRFARETEVMKLTEGQSDMSGAMNILSVARTIQDHPKVQKLMVEAQAQIDGGSNGQEVR